jgi:hypothetical protein
MMETNKRYCGHPECGYHNCQYQRVLEEVAVRVASGKTGYISHGDWRHPNVVIADIKRGRAKCHNLIYGEPKKMSSRGSWISFKGLAIRWQTCTTAECWCKGVANER